MASFPTYQFTRDYVKVRFLEENGPRGINKRWLGMPRGVYLGFTPQVVPGSDVLTLAIDGEHGFSLLKVGSQSINLQVDLFIDENIELDFTGHTEWPIYVIGRADWQFKTTTQARILTRTSTANGPQEVLICKVDKVGTNLTVEFDLPTTRQPPIAFQGQSFGFMQEESVENIILGNSATSEIIAARQSANTGTTYPSLKERIDGDLVDDSMADRIGLRPSQLLGNVKTNVTGTSANVTGSFLETGREFEPKIEIAPDGDESTEGALSAPHDTDRNLCFVLNSDNGQRLVDESSQDPVYGELVYSDGNLGALKDIRFFNASTVVDGGFPATNPFTAPIEEGDAVLAPDGKYYEITTIIDPNNAELGSAYQGTDATVTGAPYKRFTLSFNTVASGSVSVSNKNIRFLFPAFFRSDRSIFDGFLLAHKDGELPPTPTATDSVEGKSLVAADGGKVGSIRTIEDSGISVLNDAHTLNFVYGDTPGSIVQNAGAGVCEVAIVGPAGPAGADANVGPSGPTGPPGHGYEFCNPFEAATWTTRGPGPGSVSINHTVDFSAQSPALSNIKHLWGGFAGIQYDGNLVEYRITDIVRVNNTTGRIEGYLAGGGSTISRAKLYLGASQ